MMPPQFVPLVIKASGMKNILDRITFRGRPCPVKLTIFRENLSFSNFSADIGKAMRDSDMGVHESVP